MNQPRYPPFDILEIRVAVSFSFSDVFALKALHCGSQRLATIQSMPGTRATGTRISQGRLWRNGRRTAVKRFMNFLAKRGNALKMQFIRLPVTFLSQRQQLFILGKNAPRPAASSIRRRHLSMLRSSSAPSGSPSISVMKDSSGTSARTN